MLPRKYADQGTVSNVDTDRPTVKRKDTGTGNLDTDLLNPPTTDEPKDKTSESPEIVSSYTSGSSVEIISGDNMPEIGKVNLVQHLQKIKEENEILQGKLKGYKTLGKLYEETREELKKIKKNYSSSQSEYSITPDDFLISKDSINEQATDESKTLTKQQNDMQTENDLELNKSDDGIFGRPTIIPNSSSSHKVPIIDVRQKTVNSTGETDIPIKSESDEKALKEAVSAYLDYMKGKFKGASPLEKDVIKQEHKQASAIAWGILKKSASYCDNTLQERLLPHYQKFVQENNTLSREKCYLLMEHHFADIDAAIKSNSYICENGYEQYLEDRDEAIEKYKNQYGKGPMSNHVMEEYLLKRKPEEEKIQSQIQLVAYDERSMTWDDSDVMTQAETICDTICRSIESPDSLESLHVGQELMAFTDKAMKMEQQQKKYKMQISSLSEQNDKLKHTYQQTIKGKDQEIAQLKHKLASEKQVTKRKCDEEEIPSFETPSTSLTIPEKEWIHVVENSKAEKEDKQYKCDESTEREIEFQQKNTKLKLQMKELAKANSDWEIHTNQMKDHFRAQVINLNQKLEESQEDVRRLEESQQNMEIEINERTQEKLKECEDQRTKAVSFASAQSSKVDELKRKLVMEQNKSQDLENTLKHLQSIVGTQKEEIDGLNIQMKALKDSMTRSQVTEDAVHLTMDNRPPASFERIQRNGPPREQDSLQTEVLVLKQQDSMTRSQVTEDAVHLTMDNRPPASFERIQRNGPPREQDSLQTEVLVLKQQVTIYKEDFDRERRDREKAQSELSTIRNTFGQLNTDNRHMQTELQRKNTETEALKAAREKDRTTMQRKQEEINRLNVALNNCEVKNRDLQRQIEVLRRQANQRHQQPPPYEYNPRPEPVRHVSHHHPRNQRVIEAELDFLPESWRRQIQSNLTKFTMNLRPDDVILQLYTKGIISYTEKQNLECITAEYKRSEKLIFDVVMRSTKSDLAVFKQILIDTQQLEMALLVPGESRPFTVQHGGEKWNCLVCTYENSGDRSTCKMCRTQAPRPGAHLMPQYTGRMVEQCDGDSLEWVRPAQLDVDGDGNNDEGDSENHNSSENDHASSTGRKVVPE